MKHVGNIAGCGNHPCVGEAGGRHARRKGAPYRQAGDVACWRCGTTANSEKRSGADYPAPQDHLVRSLAAFVERAQYEEPGVDCNQRVHV